MFKRAIVK